MVCFALWFQSQRVATFARDSDGTTRDKLRPRCFLSLLAEYLIISAFTPLVSTAVPLFTLVDGVVEFLHRERLHCVLVLLVLVLVFAGMASLCTCCGGSMRERRQLFFGAGVPSRVMLVSQRTYGHEPMNDNCVKECTIPFSWVLAQADTHARLWGTRGIASPA